MSNLIPKMLSKLTRFPIAALPYSRVNEAVPREIVIDYDNGDIYVMNENGKLIELSRSISASSVYIKNENGDIVSLETLLHEIIAKTLDVKEVDQMAIFRIPNPAQFDLKSVILKNNLVQVYNFDQAQEDSIPVKINDRITWVHKDTLLRSGDIAISAEGCFDILDLPIQSDHPFQSVTVSEAKNEQNEPIPDANGTYTATTDTYVWVRTIADGNVYTATYHPESNKWTIAHPNDVIYTAIVQTTNSGYNEVTLIENKKQQTAIPNGLELNVFLPESTGDLIYSKIIWRVITGEVPPVLNFMTTANGSPIVATNIVWEYALDNQVNRVPNQPSENLNTFYTFETWNNGESWFAKKVDMGKTTAEIDEDYFNTLLTNYYTKEEIDDFTIWEVTPE